MSPLTTLKPHDCRMETLEEKLPLAAGEEIYSLQALTAADIQTLMDPPELPETPQERVERLSEVKTLAESSIETLHAGVNNRNDELAQLEETLAEIDRELEHAALGTTTIRIETPLRRNRFTLYYEHMPEGMRAVILMEGQREDVIALRPGTHSEELVVPWHRKWGRKIIEVRVLIEESATGAPLGITPAFKMRRSITLDDASSTPVELAGGNGGDTSALEARQAAAQGEVATLLAKRDEALAELNEARTLLGEVTEDLRAAREELEAYEEIQRQAETLAAAPVDEILSATACWDDRDAMADALAAALYGADPSLPTQAGVAALTQDLDTIRQDIAETEAEIARVREETDATQKRLTQTEGELERAVVGAPTVWLDTPMWRKRFTLYYERMPEGMSAVILVDGRETDIIALRPGTRSEELVVPWKWGRKIVEVRVLVQESATRTPVGVTPAFKAQLSTTRIVASSTPVELAGGGGDAVALEAERAAVAQALAELERELATAQETLAGLEARQQELEEQFRALDGVPTVEEDAAQRIGNAVTVCDSIATWTPAVFPETVTLKDGAVQLAQEYAELSAYAAGLSQSIDTLQPLLAGEDAHAEQLQSNIEIVLARLETQVRSWQARNATFVQIMQDAVEAALRPEADTLNFTDPVRTIEGNNPGMVVALPELGGSASLQSWRGTAQSGSLAASEEGDALHAQGALLSIDLQQADGLVTTFDAGIETSTGTGVVAGFFRGSTLIGQQTIASGSAVHFEDAAGITSVVLRPQDKNATITLSDATVTGQMEEFQAQSDPIGHGSNKWVDLYTAPQWESGANYNYIETGIRRGADYSWSNEKPVSGLPMIPNAMGSNGKYRNFTVTAHNGSVHIAGVFYINQDGVYRLPEDYYTQESAQSVTIHAGAAPNLAFQVLGRGNYNFGIKQGETRETVAPPKGIVLQPDILAFRSQHCGQEGFSNPVLEITEGRRPILSGAMHLVANIYNVGNSGGEVTVGVYCGYTGTVQDQLMKTFTTNFGPNQVKGFYADFNAPQVRDGEYPVVTIRAVLPNGSEVTTTSGGGRYRSMDLRVANYDENGRWDGTLSTVSVPRTLEEQQREARIAYKTLEAALARNDTSRDYEGYVTTCNTALQASLDAFAQQNVAAHNDIPEDIAQLQQGMQMANIVLEGDLLAARLGAGIVTMAEYNEWLQGVLQIMEPAAKEAVENTIQERVTARLNERLQNMTLEERANARGLIRLQEDGKLEEYFASLFTDNSSEAVSTALENNEGYSVYYLLDTDVLVGAGHAAMIMGSDNEGWYYFSFGVGTNDQGKLKKYLTANGNMDVNFFLSLDEAIAATNRYEHFLRWNVQSSAPIRSAFKRASGHLITNYNLFTENCDDIASDIIRAAGININDAWIPINTFNNNTDNCDESGDWYSQDR